MVDLCEVSSEPWTADVVLRLIKEAGPPGATFEVTDVAVETYILICFEPR